MPECQWAGEEYAETGPRTPRVGESVLSVTSAISTVSGTHPFGGRGHGRGSWHDDVLLSKRFLVVWFLCSEGSVYLIPKDLPWHFIKMKSWHAYVWPFVRGIPVSHRWHCGLSQRQSLVPPVKTKFALVTTLAFHRYYHGCDLCI